MKALFDRHGDTVLPHRLAVIISGNVLLYWILDWLYCLIFLRLLLQKSTAVFYLLFGMRPPVVFEVLTSLSLSLYLSDGVMKDWEEEVIREMDWVEHPSIKYKTTSLLI